MTDWLARGPQLVDAYNARDVDRFLEFASPDCEWSTAMATGLEATVYRGYAGIRAYFEELSDVWEQLRIEAGDYRALGTSPDGPSVFMILGRVDGLGKRSGVRLDSPFGMASEVIGDRWVRSYSYLDHRLAHDRAAELLQHG
jgi:ketosteroid isomerase-like protein